MDSLTTPLLCECPTIRGNKHESDHNKNERTHVKFIHEGQRFIFSQHWIKQSKDYIWSNLTRWSEKDHLIDWCTLHKFKIKTQRFQEYLNINDILKMLLLSTDMTIFTFKFTTYLDVNLWLNIITCMGDHRWYLWKNRFGWTNYKLTPKHVIDLSVKMVVSKVFLNWILKATKLP